jgi:hypothetical protein
VISTRYTSASRAATTTSPSLRPLVHERDAPDPVIGGGDRQDRRVWAWVSCRERNRCAPFSCGLLVVVAAVNGFWPLSVSVMGDTSYSCGSGVLHSKQVWKVDTRAFVSQVQPPGTDTSSTPLTACPSRLYGQRDLAYRLIGFAAVGGVCGVALLPSESGVADRTNREQDGRLHGHRPM